MFLLNKSNCFTTQCKY